MQVTLYSTGCPKCSVLKQKLKNAGIEFIEQNDIEEMIALGLQSAPTLLVINGEKADWFDFAEAIQWVNSYGKEDL